MVIALLQCARLVRLELQKLGDIGAHVPVDLREQVDVMRIERVVEIEDPVSDMGEFGGLGDGLWRVHTALSTPAERKNTGKPNGPASSPLRPAGRLIARPHGTMDPHYHRLTTPA